MGKHLSTILHIKPHKPISTHPQKGLFKASQPHSTNVSTSPKKTDRPAQAAEALDGLSLAPGSEARQARKALIERIEWLQLNVGNGGCADDGHDG